MDASDYTVWRDLFGQTGTGLAADGNDNGQIDSDDYSIWKNNFGQHAGKGLGATVAVPQPGTAELLTFAAAGWCLWRGR